MFVCKGTQARSDPRADSAAPTPQLPALPLSHLCTGGGGGPIWGSSWWQGFSRLWSALEGFGAHTLLDGGLELHYHWLRGEYSWSKVAFPYSQPHHTKANCKT